MINFFIAVIGFVGFSPLRAQSVIVSSAAVAKPPVSSSLLGVSTITISMLYNGDRVRDPFTSYSAGFVVRERDTNAQHTIDIHALQLRGILKDSTSDFAVFRNDEGSSLVLRSGRLYDSNNKVVRGITGRIRIKQKRAELITEDKDVQIYTLGETDDEGNSKQ